MQIDLNSDLGESFGRWQLGDDEAMLSIITSANLACGFHAGDPTTLHRTCRAAVQRDVRIGAQVGYRDLAGFGRRYIDVAPEDLTADVLYQLGALDGLARSVGGRVTYLKPHGALYHAVTDGPEQATAVVDALVAYDDSLTVLGFPGSALLEIAAARGLRTVTEYFIDRGYTKAGRLIDRRSPGALITDPTLAAERAVDAARRSVADSFCTHGDSPDAVGMARAVQAALTEAGVRLVPFS